MKKATPRGWPFSWMDIINLGELRQTLRRYAQCLSSLLGQHVAVLVLNHAIEVQPGDPLSDARLAYAQGHISFDTLPKIAFQGGQSDMLLHFFLVLLYDV